MFESTMLQIITDPQCKVHSHKDFEIFYVMQGKVSVTIEGVSYIMQERDIVIINANEQHGWQTFGKCLMVTSHMNYYEIIRMINSGRIHFNCNSVCNDSDDYDRIRYLMNYLLSVSTESSMQMLFKGIYYEMWHTAMQNYSGGEKTEKYDSRMAEMLDYISEHYAEQITLSVLAEKWYMSESAFSRYFKKNMDVNYSEYLMEYRLDRVCEKLINTNNSIADIAVTCGFTDTSVLNKNFKKRYHCTPVVYRKQYAGNSEKKNRSGDREQVIAYLNEAGYRAGKNVASKNVMIDVRAGKLFKNSAKSCMNVGSASNVLIGKYQNHIRELQKYMNFQYLRIKNIVDIISWEKMDEFGDFRFELLDDVLDFIVNIGAIPILVLTDEPETLIFRIGSGKEMKKKFNEKMLSLKEWKELLETLLKHLAQRYSMAMIREWQFEVRENPKTFRVGDIPFLEFYEQIYRIFKTFLPDTKLGAGGLNQIIAGAKMRENILFWDKQNIMPDYLTIISYPYAVDLRKEEPQLMNIEGDKLFLQRDIMDAKRILTELGHPDLPVWVSEWNTTLSERNVYNDSSGKGCHLIAQMLPVFLETESIGYNSPSDYIFASGDIKHILHGGTGLLSKDGLKKPSFFAVDALCRIPSRLLELDERYIVTADAEGEMTIVVANPQTFAGLYFLKHEDAWTYEELPYVFSNAGAFRISFEFTGMRDGDWVVRRSRVTDTDGTILAEWKKMNYSAYLNNDSCKYFDRICIPRLEVDSLEVHNGKGSVYLEIEENEFDLITIQKY